MAQRMERNGNEGHRRISTEREMYIYIYRERDIYIYRERLPQ